MGLLNDVTEGVNELIKYGNVGGLIRSVTHGVSNSAAKVAKVHIFTVDFTGPSDNAWFSITEVFHRVILPIIPKRMIYDKVHLFSCKVPEQ